MCKDLLKHLLTWPNPFPCQQDIPEPLRVLPEVQPKPVKLSELLPFAKVFAIVPGAPERKVTDEGK